MGQQALGLGAGSEAAAVPSSSTLKAPPGCAEGFEHMLLLRGHTGSVRADNGLGYFRDFEK